MVPVTGYTQTQCEGSAWESNVALGHLCLRGSQGRDTAVLGVDQGALQTSL